MSFNSYSNILSDYAKIEHYLCKKKIFVVGDFFLDRYIYLSDSKTSISQYTGMPACVVDRIVTSPGAAGTIAKNLAMLGVNSIYAIGFCGNDGDGFTLQSELSNLNINIDYFITAPECRTPSYTMMMRDSGAGYEEIAEFSVCNHTELPSAIETQLISHLYSLMEKVQPDAVIFLDQLEHQNYGVITEKMRLTAATIKHRYPNVLTYVDSRSFINKFKLLSVLKCNNYEFARAYSIQLEDIPKFCRELSNRSTLPIIVTLGSGGVVVGYQGRSVILPAIRIEGKIDTRGAGDAFSSGFVLALINGISVKEAAIIGNAFAACCVSQIATTGKITSTAVKEILKHFVSTSNEVFNEKRIDQSY